MLMSMLSRIPRSRIIDSIGGGYEDVDESIQKVYTRGRVDVASTSKKVIDNDDDFDEFTTSISVKKVKNTIAPKKNTKTQNRLPKNIILPGSRDSFENIVASEEEVKLPESGDYNAGILKLKSEGSSHGLDVLTNEFIELRKEFVMANENHKALEEKIDLGFMQMKEFVVNSNKKLLEDISLLVAKRDDSSFSIRKVREPSNKEACETFSGGLNFNGGSCY